jgi:hypothetical protein
MYKLIMNTHCHVYEVWLEKSLGLVARIHCTLDTASDYTLQDYYTITSAYSHGF